MLLSEFSAMPSMIPCTLCVHLLVSSEYPAYAVYSHILCRQMPAGRSKPLPHIINFTLKLLKRSSPKHPENASVLRAFLHYVRTNKFQTSLNPSARSALREDFRGMFAPVSFCFLWSLSFLFLRKEKEKESNE